MSSLSAIVRRIALLCLPFAAVFVAGITLSPKVSAQYPGGYPGGGSGGIYPGWHPIKPDSTLGNDTLDDPYRFFNYDWTHLKLWINGSSIPEVYSPDTVSGYQGLPPASGGGYPGGGYPGSKPVLRSQSVVIDGSSTIKFKWVPPTSLVTGQPDWTDFPSPSLFVLGRVNGIAGTWYDPSYGTIAGLLGNSLFQGGISVPDVHILSAPGNTGPLTRRAVLSAGVSPAGFGMSPSITVNLSGYGSGTGANGGGQLEERAFPILLSAPNPLTSPLLGDGTNQYAYSADFPDGYLTVPASTNALMASTDDTTFLLPHVSLFVSPTMQTGAQPFQWANYGSQMYVYTPGSYPPNSVFSPGSNYPSAAFIYKGLPLNNSYFGSHVMTMKVDNAVSQIANYQLFFNATANNFPGATSQNVLVPNDTSPNWYHYYNLLYPSGGTYQNSSNSSSTGQNVLTGTISTTIRNDAHGPFSLNMYHIGANPNKYIEHAGSLQLSGIHTYIYDCAHEATHRQYLGNGTDSGVSDGRRRQVNPNAITPNQDPTGDWDGDGLTNAWEIAHHLNPQDPDTTSDYQGIDGNPKYIGDSEVYADIGGWGALKLFKGAWQQDWASDGLQWGNWFATDPIANPVCISPQTFYYHPWTFQGTSSDFNSGQAQTDPSADILAAMPN